MRDLTKIVKFGRKRNMERLKGGDGLKHHKENCKVQGEEESEGQAYWQRMGGGKMEERKSETD